MPNVYVDKSDNCDNPYPDHVTFLLGQACLHAGRRNRYGMSDILMRKNTDQRRLDMTEMAEDQIKADIKKKDIAKLTACVGMDLFRDFQRYRYGIGMDQWGVARKR